MELARELLGTQLIETETVHLTLGHVVLSGLIIAVTFVLSHLVRRGTRRAFEIRGVADEGTIGVTTRLIHYVVLLIGFSIALEAAGVHLSALFAAGAIFAVGLGFAMQTITENFVSGLILLVERSIRPGDVLELGDDIVKVRRMYIRSTVVETLDDLDVIVPNSDLVQGRVRNLTYLDKIYRVTTTVGVHYQSDMDQVRVVLEHAGAQCAGRLRDKPPIALLLEFGDNSVVWEVSVWTDDPWRQRRLRSALNEQIWVSLKEARITIAYPQVDVHIKSGGFSPPPDPSA